MLLAGFQARPSPWLRLGRRLRHWNLCLRCLSRWYSWRHRSRRCCLLSECGGQPFDVAGQAAAPGIAQFLERHHRRLNGRNSTRLCLHAINNVRHVILIRDVQLARFGWELFRRIQPDTDTQRQIRDKATMYAARQGNSLIRRFHASPRFCTSQLLRMSSGVS